MPLALNRRSFLRRLSVGAASGSALGLIVGGRALGNENDPHNFGRRSVSDHDPNDLPGRGRGTPPPATDSDGPPAQANGRASTQSGQPQTNTATPPATTSTPPPSTNSASEAVSDGDDVGDGRGQPAH